MSEDSDYTSDINFPTQHQNNISAHQFPREQYRLHGRHDDHVDATASPSRSRGRENPEEYYSGHDYYNSRTGGGGGSGRGSRVDRVPSFEDERMYSGGVDYDRGYERLPYYPGGGPLDSLGAEMEYYMYGGGGGGGGSGLGSRGSVRDILAASPYHPVRSDTDSEPLYYNSRPPNSRPHCFPNERYVQLALSTGYFLLATLPWKIKLASLLHSTWP